MPTLQRGSHSEKFDSEIELLLRTVERPLKAAEQKALSIGFQLLASNVHEYRAEIFNLPSSIVPNKDQANKTARKAPKSNSKLRAIETRLRETNRPSGEHKWPIWRFLSKRNGRSECEGGLGACQANRKAVTSECPAW